MYAKIENGKLIFPPHNDGNKINVHLNPTWLADNGFVDMSQEEIDAILNPEIKPEPVEPEEQTVFSKLSIRRAMRELNLEDKLNELLDSSETFRNDWQDAQEIDLNDPILIEALSFGGLSKFEIDMIKEHILSEIHHDSI